MDTTNWITTLPDPLAAMYRIAGKVSEDGNGCWIWQGRVDKNGYGIFRLKGRHTGAHRAAWMAYRSDIPTGLVIDHLCRVRKCVNPWHLEVVTGRVNTQRGHLKGRSGRRRNLPGLHACGTHGRTDGYERTWKDGYTRWVCRTCTKINNDRFKAAKTQKERATTRR